MERLIRPAIDGGLPYINQDFFNVLQENNLLSYKSFLEKINDRKDIGNSGIIIKGVKNVTPSLSTFAYFDFTNSMIYLDGDFLEPIPSLASNNNNEIFATKFWLVKKQQEEKREKKVSGFSEIVLIKSYFGVETDPPTAGQSYIEIEIINDINYCERYLDRILRYYITEFKQIQMTLISDNFDENGNGFGEMYGFAICNGYGGKTLDLQKKFLLGYSTQSSATPASLPITNQEEITNYKKLSNTGGMETVQLTDQHITSHNHFGWTENADNDLEHSHEITVADPQQTTNNFVPDFQVFGKSRKMIGLTSSRTIAEEPGLPWVEQSNPQIYLGYDGWYSISNPSYIQVGGAGSLGQQALWKKLRGNYSRGSFGPANYPNFPESSVFDLNTQLPVFTPTFDWLTTEIDEPDEPDGNPRTLISVTNFPAAKQTGSNSWDHTENGKFNSDNDPIDAKLNEHTHKLTMPDGYGVPHNNLPPYVDVIYYEKINPYIQ